METLYIYTPSSLNCNRTTSFNLKLTTLRWCGATATLDIVKEESAYTISYTFFIYQVVVDATINNTSLSSLWLVKYRSIHIVHINRRLNCKLIRGQFIVNYRISNGTVFIPFDIMVKWPNASLFSRGHGDTC